MNKFGYITMYLIAFAFVVAWVVAVIHDMPEKHYMAIMFMLYMIYAEVAFNKRGE